MEILRRTWRLESTGRERLQTYVELEPLWLAGRLPTASALDAAIAVMRQLPAEDADGDEPAYLASFSDLCQNIARDVSRESPMLAAFFFRQALSSDLSLIGPPVAELGMPFRQLAKACASVLRVLDVTMDYDQSLADRLGVTAPVQRELFDAFTSSSREQEDRAGNIVDAATVARVRSVCRDLASSAMSVGGWLNGEEGRVEVERVILAQENSRDRLAELLASLAKGENALDGDPEAKSRVSLAQLTFGNQRLAAAVYTLRLGNAAAALSLSTEGLTQAFLHWHDPTDELLWLDPFDDGQLLPLTPGVNEEGDVIDLRESTQPPPVSHRLTIVRLLSVYLQAASELGQDLSADPIADKFLFCFTRAHRKDWVVFDSRQNSEIEIVDPDVWVAHRLATPWSLPVEARWSASLEKDLLVRGAAFSTGGPGADSSSTALTGTERNARGVTPLPDEKVDQILKEVAEFRGAFSLYEANTRQEFSSVRETLNAGEVRRDQSSRFLREAIRHWDALHHKTRRELDNAEAAYRQIMAGTSADGAPRQTAIALGVAFEVERRRNRDQVLPGESDFTALRNSAAHPEGSFGLFELERMRALLFGLGTRNDGILEMLAAAAAREDR